MNALDELREELGVKAIMLISSESHTKNDLIRGRQSGLDEDLFELLFLNRDSKMNIGNKKLDDIARTICIDLLARAVLIITINVIENTLSLQCGSYNLKDKGLKILTSYYMDYITEEYHKIKTQEKSK